MARMSALLVKRPPWGSAILLPAIIALAARSMVCRDALEWTGVDADDADSAAIVTSGVATSRLGVSFVRRQELLHPTDRNASSAAARAVDAAPLGMRWNPQPLPEHPTLLRRLGIGWEREVHDERASYRDRFELTLPLWLLAGVFAISPAHFLLARRRERATAARADRASDAPVANIAIAGRPPMKYGLPIGIACGVVVGAIAMSLLVPRAKPPASDGAAGSAPQATARRKRPIHPIVGTWRAFIDVGIAAIYRFDNDGTFALTIKPLPRLGISGPATHEAAGTWKVAGNALSMINTSSNTPISAIAPATGPISARTISPSDRPSRRVDRNSTVMS